MRVTFSEQDHRYTDTVTEQDYISVTTLINRYTPPFQSDYWATYKAVKDVLEPIGRWFVYKRKAGGWENVVDYYKKHGANPLDTGINKRKEWYLNKWEEEKRKACELGTARHKEKEIEVLGTATQHIDDAEHLSYSSDVDIFEGVENGIFAELLIYDTEYGIAGQVDYVRKTGKHLWISDYKTSKKITNEPFMDKRMLSPLDELYDTTYNHYMLQLSLYGYLLERRGFIIEGLDIIHLDRETGEHKQTIQIEYRPELVKLMIEDYANIHAC
jgi:hypothetical protein